MQIRVYCSSDVVYFKDESGFLVIAAQPWALSDVRRNQSFRSILNEIIHSGISSVIEASWFDLDTAVLACNFRARSVHAAIGGRGGHRWYYRHDSSCLYFYDTLLAAINSSISVSDINVRRVEEFLARATTVGPFDIEEGGETFLKGIFAARRPALHSWSFHNRGLEHTVLPISRIPFRTASIPDSSDALLHAAFEEHLECITQGLPVCVETSGGIDSGIVLAKLFQMGLGSRATAVSYEFPFPEFENENRFRKELLSYIGAPSIVIRDPMLLPFAALEQIPIHDEPSTIVSSWKQTHELTKLATQYGSRTVLTGHGGDKFFCPPQHSDSRMDFHVQAQTNLFFSEARIRIASVSEALRARFVNLSTPAEIPSNLLESSWMYRYARSSKDTNYGSGLLSYDLIRALNVMRNERDVSKHQGYQKPLARAMFRRLLPDSIWRREGKVNHLGLVYRGAMHSRDSINDVVRSGEDLVEASGIRKKKLYSVLESFTKGVRSADPLVNAAIAVALWYSKLRGFIPSHGTGPSVEEQL